LVHVIIEISKLYNFILIMIGEERVRVMVDMELIGQ